LSGHGLLVVLIAFFLAVTAPRTSAQQSRRYIAPRTAADATLPPYSGAVQVGNTLYLSGDAGVDAKLVFGTDEVPFSVTFPGIAPNPDVTRDYDRFSINVQSCSSQRYSRPLSGTLTGWHPNRTGNGCRHRCGFARIPRPELVTPRNSQEAGTQS
jgi:hypothetical protein